MWSVLSLLGIFPLVSCAPDAGQVSPSSSRTSASSFRDESAPTTFIANVKDVRASLAYRQGCWLSPESKTGEASFAALCVDLENQVHLVIFSNRPARKVTGKMSIYQISAAQLRSSMHPGSTVFGNTNVPIAGIFRVPEDCGEAFAADAFNALLGTTLKPRDFRFQYD
ncbi:MAG: hypothetical protein EOP85_04210 [Verrucomicrobiaceae bacterium]|nr:MAG: hypothetical protein EOP85_04210 [Verrucomicrobiaceae bacterium]